MGSTDLPALAEQLHMEVDDLFPVAEVLQLLRFAELSHGDLRLTNAGRRFVAADTDERKALFGKHLVACAPLAAHIKRVLDERSSHHAQALGQEARHELALDAVALLVERRREGA